MHKRLKNLIIVTDDFFTQHRRKKRKMPSELQGTVSKITALFPCTLHSLRYSIFKKPVKLMWTCEDVKLVLHKILLQILSTLLN